MDDTAQKSVHGSTPGDDVTQTQPTQPISPLSTPHKEAGPVPQPEEKVQPYIEPSGAETQPVVPEELAEHGVEAVPSSEQADLTIEQRQAGIEPAKESVSVATAPTGVVKLPTIDEANHIAKTHKKVSDSIVWLAALIIKHAKKIKI